MNQNSDIIAIVLAGGQGKRMKSSLPKVMHKLADKEIVRHVTDNLEIINPDKIVIVVGHGRELVFSLYKDQTIEFAIQEKQLGTADAVKSAEKYYKNRKCQVLVLAGDVPLLSVDTINSLINNHRKSQVAATVLTSEPDDPTGYGRIVRDNDGFVKKIVEHADSNNEELQIKEINTGIFLFDSENLASALEKIDCKNAQGEYYLTDVVKVLLKEGKKTAAVKLADYREALGINSPEQLQQLEKIYSNNKNIDKKLDK